MQTIIVFISALVIAVALLSGMLIHLKTLERLSHGDAIWYFKQGCLPVVSFLCQMGFLLYLMLHALP